MIDGIINNGKKEQLDEMSNLSNGILFTYEHEHSSGDQFWTDTAELLKKDDTFTYIKHDGWYGKDESVEVSVTEASALFHEKSVMWHRHKRRSRFLQETAEHRDVQQTDEIGRAHV